MVEHRLPTICRLGNRAAIPTIVRVPVMFGDLLLSYSAVSAGMDVEAWINGRTGESRVVSPESSDEQPPRDDRDWHRVPDRNELDLGHRLVEGFVSGVCPEIADDVCRVFSRRGGWLSEKESNHGIALATTYAYHDSLRADFPTMRSLQGYDQDPTEWQLLPADAPDFEESAVRACELICARDPRIGKVPKAGKRKRG